MFFPSVFQPRQKLLGAPCGEICEGFFAQKTKFCGRKAWTEKSPQGAGACSTSFVLCFRRAQENPEASRFGVVYAISDWISFGISSNGSF